MYMLTKKRNNPHKALAKTHSIWMRYCYIYILVVLLFLSLKMIKPIPFIQSISLYISKNNSTLEYDRLNI